MLASVTELERYMDIKFSNRQQHAAEYVLEGLQSELESYLRRPIEIGTFTENYRVESTNVGIPTSSFFYDTTIGTDEKPQTFLQPPYTVYVRNSPIVTVTSVKVTAPTPGSTQETLENGRDYVVRRYGIDVYRTFANDDIEVVYTAGLNGSEIKHFRLLILRAASREMQNMHDDVVGIKDLETRNVGPLITGFTPEELQSVRRYRRVRVA
jgi:hypothetical protein